MICTPAGSGPAAGTPTVNVHASFLCAEGKIDGTGCPFMYQPSCGAGLRATIVSSKLTMCSGLMF
eukprot:709514-Amphidinium_carterae.1